LLPLTAGSAAPNSACSAGASAASDARVPLPCALTQSICAAATPAALSERCLHRRAHADAVGLRRGRVMRVT
jgi:hypothetical protein